MSWLAQLDVALFRFVNQTCSHPVLDMVMPFFSGNPFFAPALVLLAVVMLWKGGARGRLFVLALAVVIALGDVVLIGPLKHLVGRLRPFAELADVRLLVGPAVSGSMPSSHASTWFAATMITLLFYRGSWRFMVPIAVMVGLSRIYVGVHYPSDVLAGAIVGAGYAVAGAWCLNALWQRVGRELFPLWFARLPALVFSSRHPPAPAPAVLASANTVAEDAHWLRLGYLFLGVTLLARLAYIASGTIELSKDEAYQWLWSKHLALSYYSKPPLIAYAQFLGTSLWGDRELGVRFFSPVLAAVLGAVLLRFMAREVNARLGFMLLLILNAAPLLGLGAVVMTVDPLLVLFWTLAMVQGWRAVQPDGTTGQWLRVGLCLGLAFLSKYTGALMIACWAIFMVLHRPARGHLRRPGPWLALAVAGLCTLPVVIWNSQHGWITAAHVAENAALQEPWKPTLQHFAEFLLVEAGLLHPVFFVGALWAMVGLWRQQPRSPLLVYLCCMGAPVFLGYWAYTLHSRVLPNWIAPAVVPMFCAMAVFWQVRAQRGARFVAPLLKFGLGLGFVALLLFHRPELLTSTLGHPLPPRLDPLRRARGWKDTAAIVAQARAQLLAEGKPVFIIGGDFGRRDYYGLPSQLSFYLPAARADVVRRPLVYCRASDRPENQFHFWPGYREQRRGENAIYVHEGILPRLDPGWFRKWTAGETNLSSGPVGSLLDEPPPQLREEFESVALLGVFEAKHKGRFYRPVQLFLCRNLR